MKRLIYRFASSLVECADLARAKQKIKTGTKIIKEHYFYYILVAYLIFLTTLRNNASCIYSPPFNRDYMQ